MFLIAGIGMTLPFSIIGLGIGAVYYLWLMLNDIPVGWGIAGAIFCLWHMGGAYKMMAFLNGGGGAINNAGAAACLPFAVQLFLAIYFCTSEWPSQISALWSLLLFPLSFVMQLLIQAAAELVLNLANPTGRRQ